MGIPITNIKDALSQLAQPEESPEVKENIEKGILEFLNSIAADKENRQASKKAEDRDYNNLLMLGFKQGYKKIVSKLLSSGLIKNVKISDEHGCSPMHAAIENKDLDAIRLLILNGFELSEEYNPMYKDCAVHSFAARLANDDKGLEILKYLCEHFPKHKWYTKKDKNNVFENYYMLLTKALQFRNTKAAHYLHEGRKELSIPLSMPNFYFPARVLELPILSAIEHDNLDFLNGLPPKSKKQLASTFKSIESSIQKERNRRGLKLDLSHEYYYDRDKRINDLYHYRHLRFNPLSVAVASKNPEMLKFILKTHKFNTLSFILGLTNAVLLNQPEMINILIQQIEQNKNLRKEKEIILNNVLAFVNTLFSYEKKEIDQAIHLKGQQAYQAYQAYKESLLKKATYEAPHKYETRDWYHVSEGYFPSDEQILKEKMVEDMLKKNELADETQMHRNAVRLNLPLRFSLLADYIKKGNLKSFKNELDIFFKSASSYITNQREKEKFRSKLIQTLQAMAMQRVAVGKPDEGIKLLHDYFLGSEKRNPDDSRVEKKLIAAGIADIYNSIQVANQKKLTLQSLSNVNSKESQRFHKAIACYRYSDVHELADMQFKRLVSILTGSEEFENKAISNFTEDEMKDMLSKLTPKLRHLIKQHHYAIIRETLDLKLVTRQGLASAENAHLLGPFDEYFSQSSLEARPILEQFKSMSKKNYTHANRSWQLNLYQSIEKEAKKAREKITRLQSSSDAQAIEKANLEMQNVLLTELGAINFIAWVLSEEKRWSSKPSRLEAIVQEKRFEITSELQKKFPPMDNLDKEANLRFKNWKFSNEPTLEGNFQKKYALWESKAETDSVWSKLGHRK